MNDFIMVKDKTGLARDRRTGAIVNINKKEIAEARARKEARRQQQQELEVLKDDVVSLKKDMSEIKELLLQIVSRE